jgi:hypothetical protein
LDNFTIGEIKAANSNYEEMKHTDKTQWLVDLFYIFYDAENDKLLLRIRGNDVCPGAFCSYHGITEYKYYMCLKRVKNNDLVVLPVNSEREYNTIQSNLCFAFLEKYCTIYGEQQPDSDEVHLPHTCLKIDLYDQFKSECSDPNVPHINTFLLIWKNRFPNLKIPKNTRLGKCDICVSFEQEKSILTRTTKSSYKQRKIEHFKMIRNEREANNRRIIMSNTYPFSSTVIGIDRMNALRLPQQYPFPKSWMTKNRLRYEVVSVFDGADESRNQLFHGLNCFPNDSDTTLTILYLKLCSLRSTGSLSTKLTIHMDNC